ncbi:hypothetical protein HWV62_16006 [Athelia sp. TMB]|nr:hypothetical protein HWV62_16006 [Athelia sp. TMB]
MAGRTILTFLVALAAVLGAIYQLRYKEFLSVIGVGRVIENVGPRDCKIVPELQACEKITLHQPSGVLYLACSSIPNRLVWTPTLLHLNATARFATNAEDDYIATYDPRNARITHLKASLPAGQPPLSLHGMDIVPSSTNPKDLWVYLVNHRPFLAPGGGYEDAQKVGANSTIEVFKTTVGGTKLEWVRTFHAPEAIISPNDLVGLPDGSGVYFTNDAGAKTAFKKHFSLLLRLTDSSIGFCSTSLPASAPCKLVATLPDVNGIAASPHNNTIYVSNTLRGTITALERQADDSLVVTDVIPVGYMIDNLSVDEAGHVWGGSFPYLLALAAAMENSSHPVPSAALRITLNTGPGSYYGEKYKMERVFMDDGLLVSSTTSAVYDVSRKRLFMHGLISPALTVCKV